MTQRGSGTNLFLLNVPVNSQVVLRSSSLRESCSYFSNSDEARLPRSVRGDTQTRCARVSRCSPPDQVGYGLEGARGPLAAGQCHRGVLTGQQRPEERRGRGPSPSFEQLGRVRRLGEHLPRPSTCQVQDEGLGCSVLCPEGKQRPLDRPHRR